MGTELLLPKEGAQIFHCFQWRVEKQQKLQGLKKPIRTELKSRRMSAVEIEDEGHFSKSCRTSAMCLAKPMQLWQCKPNRIKVKPVNLCSMT